MAAPASSFPSFDQFVFEKVMELRSSLVAEHQRLLSAQPAGEHDVVAQPGAAETVQKQHSLGFATLAVEQPLPDGTVSPSIASIASIASLVPASASSHSAHCPSRSESRCSTISSSASSCLSMTFPQDNPLRHDRRSSTCVATIPEEGPDTVGALPLASAHHKRRKSAPSLSSIMEVPGSPKLTTPKAGSPKASSPKACTPKALPAKGRNPKADGALHTPNALHAPNAAVDIIMRPVSPIPSLTSNLTPSNTLPPRARRPSTSSIATLGSFTDTVRTISSHKSDATSSLLRQLGILPGVGRSHSDRDPRLQELDNLDTQSEAGKSLLGVGNNESLASDDFTFKLLPLWEDGARKRKSIRRLCSEQSAIADIDRPGTSAHWCTVHPKSMKRLFWDLLTILFILHDCLIIPLQFLQLPRSPLTQGAGWIVRVFWSFDMLASTLTGFEHKNGAIELRTRSVMARYARTWFALDAVLVGIGWAEVWHHAEIPTVAFIMQVLKMLRLLRLLRLQSVVALVFRHVHTETMVLLLSIVQSIIGVVIAVHVITCCWVGLGRRRGAGWVARRDIDDQAYLEQYALSFHWALTNFYGSMDLNPTNLGERAFAIFALLTGFFIATAFVSLFTSSITRLHIIFYQQSSHLRVLAKYLQDHRISPKLASRVEMNAKHAIFEHQRNLPEADVELLKIISEPLRIELHVALYAPTLTVHPLFDLLQAKQKACMQQICHGAVSEMLVSRGDILFSEGEMPRHPKMLFPSTGVLQYAHQQADLQAVAGGEWLCEHVLWTIWTFHGTLVAETDCRLAAVDAGTCQEVFSQCPIAGFRFELYAKAFLQALNQLSMTSMPSDWGDRDDIQNFLEAACPPRQSGQLEDTPPGAAEAQPPSPLQRVVRSGSKQAWFPHFDDVVLPGVLNEGPDLSGMSDTSSSHSALCRTPHSLLT